MNYKRQQIQPIWGVVKSVNGPAIGPASQITYTVEWHSPRETFTLSSVPHRRWDDGLDTRAIPANSPVEGYLIDGRRVVMTSIEFPDHGDCQP